MSARWELEQGKSGYLALRNPDDKYTNASYMLQRVDSHIKISLNGRTGMPVCWQLAIDGVESRNFLSVTNGIVSPTVENRVKYCAVVYDSGGYCLGRFKLSDQFVEELNGGHRRTPSQVHGSPHAASGGSSGTYAQIAITTRSAVRAQYLAQLTNTLYTFRGPSEESKPIESAGIRAGEVTGYRAWRVAHGRLFSMYMEDCQWPTNTPLRAERMTDHKNGIHAFKYLGEVEHYVREWLDYRIFECHTPMVMGTVDLWGSVVEHERGWRGEFAAVRSLDVIVNNITDASLDQLRHLYGVAA